MRFRPPLFQFFAIFVRAEILSGKGIGGHRQLAGVNVFPVYQKMFHQNCIAYDLPPRIQRRIWQGRFFKEHGATQ